MVMSKNEEFDLESTIWVTLSLYNLDPNLDLVDP